MKRAVAAAILLAGCARAPDRAAPPEQAPTSSPDHAAAAPAPPSGAPVTPAALRAPPSRPRQRAAPPADAAARALERGRLLQLRLAGAGAASGAHRCGFARPGAGPPERLEALLDPGDGEPRWVGLWLAHRARPRAWRRPLAFYRLAAALGARVVPAAAPRRISVGEIGPLLDAVPGGPELLRDLAVLNDGTLDALALAPAPGPPGPRWGPADGVALAGFDARGVLCPRRVLAFESAPESEPWARWAASPAPLPGERPGLVRDYVEALALDYLAGHVLRRVVTLDEVAGAILLDDNADAFPQLIHEHALDRNLARLAAVARFPRSLRDALLRLDPAAAAAALAPGSLAPGAPAENFAAWLVPPRTLIDLDERRAALLTLIEARIAEHGEAAALSLE